MYIKLVKRVNDDKEPGFIERVFANVEGYTLRQREFGHDELTLHMNTTTNVALTSANFDTYYVMNENGKTIDRGELTSNGTTDPENK